MKASSKLKFKRGLATALSILTLAAVFPSQVYAATSNDLRYSIGMARNKSIDDNYEGNEYNKSPKVIIDYEGNETVVENEPEHYELKDGVSGKLKEHSDNANRLIAEIEYQLSSNYTAYLICNTVDELLAEKDTIKQLSSSIGNSVVTSSNEYTSFSSDEDTEAENIVLQYSGEKSYNDIKSLDFDIGLIGESLTSPVQTGFNILTPYGYIKKYGEDKYSSSKLLGIELRAQEGTVVESQFNGVIVGVTADQNVPGSRVVRVYHGNSTYTIYHHIIPDEFTYVGNSVAQGDLLGTVANTTNYESDKDNHMLYQVKLNGTFINPLVMFGSSGKRAYEHWITNSIDTNAVDKGEQYFLDESIEIPYTGSDDSVIDVLYPDFNKD